MVSAPEATRDERIDIFIESTTLRCVYELRTKHDFSHLLQEIGVGSPESLLAALMQPPVRLRSVRQVCNRLGRRGRVSDYYLYLPR
jgi:hypothetical protein